MLGIWMFASLWLSGSLASDFNYFVLHLTWFTTWQPERLMPSVCTVFAITVIFLVLQQSSPMLGLCHLWTAEDDRLKSDKILLIFLGSFISTTVSVPPVFCV